MVSLSSAVSRVDWLTYSLFVPFGVGSWIAINAAFAELPIFANEAPEGWKIASQLGFAVQLSNLFPVLYMAVRNYRGRRGALWPLSEHARTGRGNGGGVRGYSEVENVGDAALDGGITDDGEVRGSRDGARAGARIGAEPFVDVAGAADSSVSRGAKDGATGVVRDTDGDTDDGRDDGDGDGDDPLDSRGGGKNSDILALHLTFFCGAAACALAALFWRVTASGRSVGLLLSFFAMGASDAMTSVTFWPFAARFRPPYTVALALGESCSSLVAAVLALAQNPGSASGPRFSVGAYLGITAGVMVVSWVSMAVLQGSARARREMKDGSRPSPLPWPFGPRAKQIPASERYLLGGSTRTRRRETASSSLSSSSSSSSSTYSPKKDGGSGATNAMSLGGIIEAEEDGARDVVDVEGGGRSSNRRSHETYEGKNIAHVDEHDLTGSPLPLHQGGSAARQHDRGSLNEPSTANLDTHGIVARGDDGHLRNGGGNIRGDGGFPGNSSGNVHVHGNASVRGNGSGTDGADDGEDFDDGDDGAGTVAFARRIAEPLAILFATAVSRNGVVPALVTYACLPYPSGGTVLLWATILSAAAEPLAPLAQRTLSCVPEMFRFSPRPALGVWFLFAGAVLAVAARSPDPPLARSGRLSGSLPVILLIGHAFFTSFAKCGCLVRLRCRFGTAYGRSRAARMGGSAIQAGSLVGSLAMYFVVNYTDVFEQSGA